MRAKIMAKSICMLPAKRYSASSEFAHPKSAACGLPAAPAAQAGHAAYKDAPGADLQARRLHRGLAHAKIFRSHCIKVAECDRKRL